MSQDVLRKELLNNINPTCARYLFFDVARIIDARRPQEIPLLEIVNRSQQKRKVAMPWRKSLLLEINDVLITLALEDTYHMGELNALMWQSDIEPPWLSWAAFIEQNP